MRWLAITIATALLAATPARAELTYREFQTRTGEDRQLLELWLDGVVAGFGWANGVDDAENRPLPYCQPRDSVLEPEQQLRILHGYAQRNPDMLDYPLGMVMLFALRDAYPCANAV
jgi:hypothetical protein